MKNTTIGFIGCGNIATALLKGMLTANPTLSQQIIVSNRSMEKLDKLKEFYAVHTTLDNKEVASKAHILFLTVKPNMYTDLISEIKDSISKDCIVISVAAGLSISFVEEQFAHSVKVIRCMPNTPSMVTEGMSGLCPNGQVSSEDLELVIRLFSTFGKCEVVAESLFDTVTGVSGSGPAYVYLFIDAMADAAVKDGMNREQAIAFAAQTTLGAAKMVLETGIDPEQLTKNVCSPGGTTIEAVNVLKDEGLHNLVVKAQHACVEKSKKMHQ